MTSRLITVTLPDRNETFVDATGVTHEALDTDRIGPVSMCGRLRDPLHVPQRAVTGKAHAYARAIAPDGVDCMTCLVNRAGLDAMVSEGSAARTLTGRWVSIDLWVTV